MRKRPLELTVFVVGTASLGAEIAAARLMAPWFGASTVIWANTIATVLVALSVGYALGGRLADRDPTPRGLAKLVLGAAALLAIVPFISTPFLRASVEALDSVSAGAFVGSLLAVSVLIAAPILLLGMVSPYAIRLAVDSVAGAGRTAGRLYAISTIGSLVGVFAAALVLVPFVGSKRTFLVFAFALAVVAVLQLRRSPALVLAPAAIAALMFVPTGTLKSTGGGKVLWEKETEYQYARVIESPSGTRTLELNEGQAIHSLARPGTVLTGNYWDEFLVLPLAALQRPPQSLAILGNAAGTMATAYGKYFPGTEIDGVEIDGEITEAGREYFGMKAPKLKTHVADARPFLRQTDKRYDAIFVDAYRQPYIPFYLSTREFFELVEDRLNPGGVVIVNVGHPEGSDDLEQVLTSTMRSAFTNVVRDPAQDTNTMLVGSDAPVSAQRLLGAAAGMPDELRTSAAATASQLRPGLEGGRVYTDDVAPVEWLIDASIVDVAASGER
ncbi:MAG: Spermine synthase [Solirubrobacterales bacterium]|nr:Spermine synthase [Solirubrobacterales bacterium]